MREKKLYKDAGKYLIQDDLKIAPTERHWTTLKFEESIKFIEENNTKGTPFFLNLWLDAPHAPYEPSDPLVMEQYNDRAVQQSL